MNVIGLFVKEIDESGSVDRDKYILYTLMTERKFRSIYGDVPIGGWDYEPTPDGYFSQELGIDDVE